MEKLTEYEIEQMQDDGKIAAFNDELNAIFFEGYADQLQATEPQAYTEQLKQFINH